MPPTKKKRKYTFRKGKVLPYASGSLAHEVEKMTRSLYKTPKKKRKKR